MRLAETLAGACAGTLGEAVAGVILHGSLTLDDYVPGRSDGDLLAIVDDPLSDAQLDALTWAVARQRLGVPGRIDLRVVTRQVAASPAPAPPMEAYVEVVPGSGVRVERRHPGERDLVVEFPACHAHGRSLAGRGHGRAGPPDGGAWRRSRWSMGRKAAQPIWSSRPSSQLGTASTSQPA